MSKNMKFRPGRTGMMIVLASIVLLAAACGSAAAPAAAPVVAAPTTAPAVAAVAPTGQATTAASASSDSVDACALLTKDDVSKVLGAPVTAAVSSGMGGVCNYTSNNLDIQFTTTGKTGGAKAMNTQLSRLGDLAQVVPGLGDQAFFNNNPDSGAPLFLLKGDAEYLFDMSDLTYQPLDPAFVQATEKALAEKLLTHLQ